MTQTEINRKFDCKTATRAQFTAYIRELHATIDRLSSQLSVYENIVKKHHWQRTVRANEKLSTGAPKIILEALPEIIEKKQKDADGWARVYQEDIKRATGVSRSSITSAIARLDDSGIVEYKLIETNDPETNKVDSKMYLRLPAQTQKNGGSLVLLPTKDRKTGEYKGQHGGNRVKMCKICHSIDIRVVCAGCGQTLQDDDIIELTPQEYQAQVAFDQEQAELDAQANPHDELDYPESIKYELESRDIVPQPQDCIVCGHNEWLPALENGDWSYRCGYCHPHLLASQGRDLTPREGIA